MGRREAPVHLLVTRRDIIKYATATDQRLEKFLRGDEAPPMFLFGADRPLCGLDDLGADGLRADTLTPELPLKRVMAGGIRQRYHRPIRPGDELVIEKSISDIFEKAGSSGPLIFVVYTLTVKDASGALVLEETQTRINR
ncbi:MAG: MaoC family dehydratase N-terminal domain-containing protein [Gammaproteobacteria bacterium]